MDEQLRKALESIGEGLARNSGHVQGLLQAVVALIATHPNKAAFAVAYARHEVRSPIPENAPDGMRQAYEDVTQAVDLALRDNSVNRGTP